MAVVNVLGPDDALDLIGKIAEPQRLDADRSAALAVADACGGLPLALRIAGARLAARPDWPVATLAARLADERRRLAELGMGDLDVRASFHLSYRELSTRQARGFRLLSLWPGADFHPWVLVATLGIDVAAAEELVNGLVAAQLVESAAVRGRYRLHNLLRLFAHECLDLEEAAPDREGAWTRLVEYGVAVASVLNVTLTSPGPHPVEGEQVEMPRETALAWLEVERDRLVTLTGLAAEHGLWSAAGDLAERLHGPLALRGLLGRTRNAWDAERCALLGEALAAPRKLVNGSRRATDRAPGQTPQPDRSDGPRQLGRAGTLPGPRDQQRTTNPHIIVTKGTNAGRTPASTA